jgi:hypothetical protein
MMGQPCKRCGKYCREELCQLALDHLPAVRVPCPALEGDGGKYACGLVLHSSKYVDAGTPAAWKDRVLGELFAEALGIGRGCDMTMMNW